MKKFTAFLLAATMLVLTACSAAFTPSTPSSSTAGTAKKTFVMGLDDSFPPMGFRDEQNNIVGLDVDLAKAVCDKLGMTLELKPIDWATKEMELDSERIDVIWNGLTITDKRKEDMLLSRPYLANSQRIMVTKASGLDDKAKLSGKIAGVQTGSSAEEALAKDSLSGELKEAKQYSDNVMALQDLKIGRLDCVILDEVVAFYYAAKEPDTYVVLDYALEKEQYGIAFKKGNTELHDKVMKAFDELIADGTVAKISTQWLGSDMILR